MNFLMIFCKILMEIFVYNSLCKTYQNHGFFYRVDDDDDNDDNDDDDDDDDHRPRSGRSARK